MSEEKNGLKRSITLVSIVFLAIGLAICWWETSNITPVVKIPMPKMPKPNGYDSFTAAGKLLWHENQIAEASRDKYWPGGHVVGPPGHNYTLAEKEDLLKINAPVLKTIRDGLKYDCRAHRCKSSSEFDRQCRTIACLLKIEAKMKATHGDWNGAMDSCLDAMEMGTDVTRGGSLLNAFTGNGVHWVVRPEMWNVIDHLSSQQAKSAAGRLERINGRFSPMSQILEEEKWLNVSGLLDIFARPDWRKEFARDLTPPTGRAAGEIGKLRSLCLIKRRMISAQEAYMDKAAAATRKPYPMMNLPVRNRASFDILREEVFDNTRTRCIDSLLLVTLALRAYKLDHGAYPKSLNELAPVYLKSVPSDPFAATGTFKYKLTGDKYLLYSIGPDGKDDGGICARSGNWNDSYRVFENTKGDILAGVNR